MRIAIAEHRGWKRVPTPFRCGQAIVDWPVFEKDGIRASIRTNTLPDWPNDLNLMHEAEKKLNADEQRQYIDWLDSIVWKQITNQVHGFKRCHATAIQRAEAYLRTIGKWKA